MINIALSSWMAVTIAAFIVVCFCAFCRMMEQMYRHSTEALVKNRHSTTIIVGDASKLKELENKIPHLNAAELSMAQVIDVENDFNESKSTKEEKQEGNSEIFADVDLSDVEVELYNHLNKQDQEQHEEEQVLQEENNDAILLEKTKEPSSWEELGVPESMYSGFPTLSMLQDVGEGRETLLGVVYGFHEANGKYAIRFGDFQARKWVEVSKDLYRLPQHSVIVLPVIYSNEHMMQDSDEEVLLLTPNGLSTYEYSHRFPA